MRTQPARPFLGVSLVVFGLAFIGSGCASRPKVVEPTSDDKLARLIQLENERSPGGGEILTRLSDPAAPVRARAALALGRIKADDAAPSLLPLLASDSSAYVRESAAFALGLLGPGARGALDDLTQALADPSEAVRGRAAEALSRIASDPTEKEQAAEAIASMLEGAMPSEPSSWSEDTSVSSLRLPRMDLRLGMAALARLQSLRWAWPVLATDGGRPRLAWWPAASTLAQLPGDERAPLVQYYAGAPDPELRFWAARAAGSLSSTRARQPLLKLLEDPNESVRVEALKAAAATRLAAAGGLVAQHLESGSLRTRGAALEALAGIDQANATELVIDALSDSSPWIRALAWPALARQDPESLWLLLSGIGWDDPEWRVRRAIADVVGRIGTPRAQGNLRSLASQDPDPRVRARALILLSSFDQESASALALEKLNANHSVERAAAAGVLGELGPGGASSAGEPIVKAFDRQADDVTFRLAALNALSKLYGATDPRVIDVAKKALTSSDFALRLGASAILEQTNEVFELTAPAGSVSADEYLKLAAPSFTPQAFIHSSRGTIELQLFVLDAPLTVKNFIDRAREGLFDGTSFHEIDPNLSVEARESENGARVPTIRSEINLRSFVRGSVGMARSGLESSGTTFFITNSPKPQLEGHYTVFGQVTAGNEILDRIEPGDVIERIVIWDGIIAPTAPTSPPSTPSWPTFEDGSRQQAASARGR